MVKIGFESYEGLNESKVTDEVGKVIISFKKTIAVPTRSCYSVINNNNEKIGKIEKSRYNFGLVNLPEINISINDDKITVKKDMRELKDIYEIMGSDFSINGHWDGPNFTILKNEKVIASVDVEKDEDRGTYSVNIIDKSNEEQVICILFALSWIR